MTTKLKLDGATRRLALSYLAIIMLLSVSFSVVFYNASSRELGRQLPPIAAFQEFNAGNSGPGNTRSRQIDEFLAQRIAEGRSALAERLIWLNLLAVAAGSALSYYLARRTLEPIEANVEAQAQFVSDASHELRTPLTALQTSNEVALRRRSLSETEARELLRQNITEVTKLKSLTDGLLRLATQSAGPPVLEPVSLQDGAAEAMNRVINLAQSKQIAVEDSVAATSVLAQSTDVVQIVVILLENAIKYSPAGSTVYLSSSVRGRTGSIHVRDTGPGIRPYDQRRIFERFYRADQSRSRQVVEGHGIGLSLARKLAHRYGGEITVASTVGKGSSFTLKLPLAS